MLDSETAPSVGYVWGKWEQNVIDFKAQWYILCVSFMWVGGKVQNYALPDFKGYSKNKEDDRALILKVWELLDEADIVVGHNVKKFDLKKINARFIYHRLPPPSPYKVFDTLEAARKVMANNSNRLDDLGRDYELGRKLPHTGFHLWQGCMRGDKKSWKLMVKYCNQDVLLDYKFYKLIRPWTTHPNMNADTSNANCPACGSKNLKPQGVRGGYQRYCCGDCGRWSQSTKKEIDTPKIRIK